jgi:hypothetical protein
MTWQRDPERSDLAFYELHADGGNSIAQSRIEEQKPLDLKGIHLPSSPAIGAKPRPTEDVI